jgi:hypothetical protein
MTTQTLKNAQIHQTSMPEVIHALDRSATVTGNFDIMANTFNVDNISIYVT